MNFFEHQNRARKQTRWLILLFLLAVFALVVSIDAVLLLVMAWGSSEGLVNQPNPFTAQGLAANWPLLAGGAVGTVGLVGFSSLYKVASLNSGGGVVARDLGGSLVDSDTRDPLRRRLRNVVEEIAIASGVPVPEVYVLEKESAINAFAAGYSPSDAAVAVTRGALEKLNREELQGVIAHEFSHVLNGDMRLNIRLMGVLFGILVLSILGRRILFSMRYSRSSGGKNNGAALVMLAALAVVVIGYLGLFFGRWIKAAVSRQREYLADASAVQFTRNPESIGGALKKIAVYSDGSHLKVDTEEVGHMLFGEGRSASLMATHPPLEERIRRVQPDFQPGDLKVLAERIRRQQQREQEAAERGERPSSAERFGDAFGVGSVLGDMGHPGMDRLLMAAMLAGSLPPSLQEASRSAEWAPEVLMLSLLSNDPELREQQRLIIAQRLGERSDSQLGTLLGILPEIAREQRLPLMEMAFPALKRRPSETLAEVQATVDAIIHVDGRVDVFEYSLARLLAVHLRDAALPQHADRGGRATLKGESAAVASLLAIIAAHGGKADGGQSAEAGLAAGLEALGELSLKPQAVRLEDEAWQSALDDSLERLDHLRLQDKEKLLAALLAVVSQDGQVIAQEAELLRAVCGSLHIPLPVMHGSVSE